MSRRTAIGPNGEALHYDVDDGIPTPDPDDSLDAAWAEAEAALPEGWALRVQMGGYEPAPAYAAAFPADISAPAIATGDTPAAALRALAAKLREHGA